MDTITYERMATPAWPPDQRHGRCAADQVFAAHQLRALAADAEDDVLRWQHDAATMDAGEILSRLGLVQWHLAALARLLGSNLTEIMLAGIGAMEERHGTPDPNTWYANERDADP